MSGPYDWEPRDWATEWRYAQRTAFATTNRNSFAMLTGLTDGGAPMGDLEWRQRWANRHPHTAARRRSSDRYRDRWTDYSRIFG